MFKPYCLAAGLNRLRNENDHVQAGIDRFKGGNNYLHDEQDCLSLPLDRYARKQDRLSDGEDRYGGNKDRYDREEDRYDRPSL